MKVKLKLNQQAQGKKIGKAFILKKEMIKLN